MRGINVKTGEEQLLLEVATEIISRSFQEMDQYHRLKLAMGAERSIKMEGSSTKLEIERKLWDFQKSEDSGIKRAVIRFDIVSENKKYSSMVVKAGLTDKLSGRWNTGFVIGYGWKHDLRLFEYEINVMEQMKKATNNLEAHYSTPGENFLVGRLFDPIDLELYIEE